MTGEELNLLAQSKGFNVSEEDKNTFKEFVVQEIAKWLRDSKDIYINIRRVCYANITKNEYEYNEFIYLPGQNKHIDDTLGNEWDTYEDALENAVITALEYVK